METMLGDLTIVRIYKNSIKGEFYFHIYNVAISILGIMVFRVFYSVLSYFSSKKGLS